MSGKKTLAFMLLAGLCGTVMADEPVRLYAAGSLTGALTAVVKQYMAAGGEQVETVFGPSGLLREQIEQGAPSDVFASADLASPLSLYRQRKGSAPVVFARNSLCAMARSELQVTPDNFLAKLLDPAVKLGTSTPKADPGGDYAWQLFARAEQVRRGARAQLEGKALQLVGGPHSPVVPAGQDALSYFFGNGKADVFLGYCSSRQPVAKRMAQPGIDHIAVPPELAILPEYSVTVVQGTRPPRAAAYRFALFMLSEEAQRTMAEYGFIPVNVPAPGGQILPDWVQQKGAALHTGN